MTGRDAGGRASYAVRLAARVGAIGLALTLPFLGCGAERTMENDERSAEGTDWPEAAAADVESIDAIVAALYEAISFEPPGFPEWDRLRSLFHPDGRLVPPAGADGRAPVLTVEEFIENSTRYIEEGELGERGFHESELARRTERFGKVTHAFSAYASRYTADDPEPFSRGVNSIQLLWEGERWWVLSIAWDVETPENPIPEEYLEGS